MPPVLSLEEAALKLRALIKVIYLVRCERRKSEGGAREAERCGGWGGGGRVRSVRA